jgi:hypothetical protein
MVLNMSGLYNMVMGMNPAFGLLAGVVGITQDFHRDHPLGRVRDAWIEPDGKTICILHRNYGEDGQEALNNAKMLPTYRANHPASDPTYAWWVFDVPAEFEKMAKILVEKTDTRNRWDRYLEVVDKVSKGVEDEETNRAMEAGKKVFAGLNYAMQEGIAEVKHGEGEVVIESVEPKESK